MKLKKGIVLGSVDGKDFAIATGKLSKKISGLINITPTANYIFQLLQAEQTEESIVKAMCDKYDAPENVIRSDVREIIQQLKEMDILDL